METLENLQQEQATILSQLAVVDTKIKEKKKQTLVQCTNNCHGKGCGMGYQINNLTYIQTHWYETPSGCTGGDMWHQGEGKFICPSCGHKNRLYDRPEIEELKPLFKDVVDEY